MSMSGQNITFMRGDVMLDLWDYIDPVMIGDTCGLVEDKNGDYITNAILTMLVENKVSLAEARGIFKHILRVIEEKNPVSQWWSGNKD